jgi:hypothetical protein
MSLITLLIIVLPSSFISITLAKGKNDNSNSTASLQNNYDSKQNKIKSSEYENRSAAEPNARTYIPA